MQQNYQSKYIKYKSKYTHLKNSKMTGGDGKPIISIIPQFKVIQSSDDAYKAIKNRIDAREQLQNEIIKKKASDPKTPIAIADNECVVHTKSYKLYAFYRGIGTIQELYLTDNIKTEHDDKSAEKFIQENITDVLTQLEKYISPTSRDPSGKLFITYLFFEYNKNKNFMEKATASVTYLKVLNAYVKDGAIFIKYEINNQPFIFNLSKPYTNY